MPWNKLLEKKGQHSLIQFRGLSNHLIHFFISTLSQSSWSKYRTMDRYICKSVSALQISSSLPFCRFHMYALIYNVCFSDLVHSVWQLLGPSTFKQMAQFCFFFFFLLYIIILVLPNIKMNPPQVYTFWWLSNIPLSYVSHIIFIHASVDGLWACLHVLAIVNSPTVNIGVHVSFLNYDFSLSICPGVGFLGLMVMTKMYLMDWPKSLFAKSKYSSQK